MKECFLERVVIVFFSRFGPVDHQSDTHTVYLPLPPLRAHAINYVFIKFSSFDLFSLFGASVSLLPASSLRTEAWFTGECLPVCPLGHTGKILYSLDNTWKVKTKILCQIIQCEYSAWFYINCSPLILCLGHCERNHINTWI